MDRTYSSGAAGSAPAAPASPSSGYPTAGNPGAGTPATKPGPYWYHMIMEELMTVILSAGITPAQGTLTQLKQALDKLYGMPIAGASKNLVIKNNATTPNIKVDLSADELVLKSAAGVPVFVTALALTGDITASGAGGIDTGAKANTTWYAIWAINNGTTTNLLFSLSFTTPTMPGGYGFKALVGAVRTDASGNFVKFWQYQNRVHTQQQNVLNNGGAASANVFQALSISPYIPPTAKRCFGLIGSNSTASGDGWLSCAADANGAGKTGFNAAVFSQVGTGAFSMMAPFDVGVSNPQNLYWTQEVTGSAVVKIDVTGYEF